MTPQSEFKNQLKSSSVSFTPWSLTPRSEWHRRVRLRSENDTAESSKQNFSKNQRACSICFLGQAWHVLSKTGLTSAILGQAWPLLSQDRPGLCYPRTGLTSAILGEAWPLLSQDRPDLCYPRTGLNSAIPGQAWPLLSQDRPDLCYPRTELTSAIPGQA